MSIAGRIMKERFETFTVLITKISRNIRRIKNQKMADYDLRSPQISCLYYLYSDEGITATELCERCEEDKATISRSLEHLKENGYLLPSGSGTRKYRSPLRLTEKGREVAKRVHDKVDRVLNEINACLTEEERLSFYRSLTIISDSLDRIATDD